MCLHLCTASPLTAGWFSETFWLSDHHIRQTSDSEPGMFPCIFSIHPEVSLPGWKISLRSVFILQINQKGSEKPLEQAFAKMVGSLGNGMIKWVNWWGNLIKHRRYRRTDGELTECVLPQVHRVWLSQGVQPYEVASPADPGGHGGRNAGWVRVCGVRMLKVIVICDKLVLLGVIWMLLFIFLNSYFLVDSDGSVQMQQDGTFRSNCMDCLDRTNVIQSLLARRSLQSQLEVCVWSSMGASLGQNSHWIRAVWYHSYI